MIIQQITKDILVAIADARMHGTMYVTINSISSYLALFLGILHGRKLGLRWHHAIIPVVVERNTTGYLMSLVLWIENGFQPGTVASAPVAYPYIPILAFLVAKLLRTSWKEVWDAVMPVPLMMFVGARVACTVAGCCYGYPCSWGIYNVNLGIYVFPIQLVEALATVLILAAVYRREKKNNFVPDGRNVPIILISYGIVRFFLEFFHDNKKIIFGLATTSFHCLIMIAAGLIALWLIRRSEQTQGGAICADIH